MATQTQPEGKGKPQEMPQAPDAEKGVLCSILLAPDAVFDLCTEASVAPDSFYIPAHREIFETLHALHGASKPLDFITIAQHLKDRNRLDQVGGPAMLTELFVYVGTAANASHYIGIVQESARRRELIGALEIFHRRAFDGAEDLEGLRGEAQAALLDGSRKGPKPTPLVSIMEISAGPHDARASVLGNRFLCIGGAMLFVGPSGIGKSSASIQQDILWGLGRPAFGIRPCRPLCILTIQAENDGEDLAEMRDGVIQGLNLTAEDRAAVRGSVFYETECGRTGPKFLEYVDRRLSLGQFDILRLDPLLAYLGADINDAEHTAAFLRSGLNPLLAKHRVACILNHHTPKVTNRDTSTWRASDWMYAGAGSADVTNWARAALVIDPTHANHVFKFIAAKRGNRIGWSDDAGEREIMRYFCHASDGLYWREATAEDVADVEAAREAKKNGKPVKTAADMRAIVPLTGAMPKNKLLETARSSGFTKQAAANVLKELLESEELFAWQVKRSGTNDEVRISRHEQTLAEVNG